MKKNVINHHAQSVVNRLELAMEVATDGIWDWNIDSNETFFDHRYYTMAGYEPNEFPGNFEEWEKRVHPEDLSQTKAEIARCYQGETDLYHADFRFKTKRGGWIWIRAKAKVFGRNRHGIPLRMIGTHTDITELKREEEKRISSQESYKLLIENAHDCIFIIQDGIIKYANPSTTQLTGYSIKELSSIPSIDLVHPDDRPRVKKYNLKRLSEERAPDYYTFRAKSKSDEDLFVEINTVRIEWKKKPAIICFVRDITQTKKMELQAAQAQKMQAIGTLAGGIAHDFNNILGAIYGYAELAQISPPESDSIKGYVKQIMAASDRAKDLVQQILAFSRQSKPEKNSVDIGIIVKEALKLLRATLPANIEIRQNVLSNQGSVFADQTQIHQVMMNLCTNAFHAMEKEGGQLDVDLIPVTISTDESSAYQDIRHGRYLRLTVADTGTGMDADTATRIFNPFFTTKDVGEGTGMGLATVHGIVKDHGGDIKVYSEPGVGTSFHILFPVVDSCAEKAVKTSDSLPKGNETILFVDDEKPLVDIGKELLENLGYQVETMTSSCDALEAIRAQPNKYDVVITDMTMPKMTGEKLAEEIKKTHPEIPIILCTGFSKRMTPENAMEIGINSILMKPLTLHDLAKTVRKALDEKKIPDQDKLSEN